MLLLNKKLDLSQFFKRLETKGKKMLILDYDGTLAPFTVERDCALPYPGVEERLEQIMRGGTHLVMATGRSLASLSSLLQLVPEPDLFGSHGLEHRGAEREKVSSRCFEGLALAKQHVAPHLLETKPYGLAVHWRGLSLTAQEELESSLLCPWKQLAMDYGLEVVRFDGGLELRPRGRGKGDIVRQLLQQSEKETVVAYLGDDTTDEEAFLALGERGLTVLVRPQLRQTAADLYLRPPEELLEFLDAWISHVPSS